MTWLGNFLDKVSTLTTKFSHTSRTGSQPVLPVFETSGRTGWEPVLPFFETAVSENLVVRVLNSLEHKSYGTFINRRGRRRYAEDSQYSLSSAYLRRPLRLMKLHSYLCYGTT